MSLLTNLVSYWTLDEASGTRADSHGTNSLTPTGTPGSAAGVINNGVDLELANSEYLSTGSSPSGLSPTNNFSISFWFRPESIGTNQLLVMKRDINDNDVTYRVFMGTTGTINFFGSNAGTPVFNITTTTTLTTGALHHIVCTKSSTTGAIIYINNVSSATDGAATGAVTTNTDPLRFGTRLRPAAQLFADGVMDEIGFWDKVLSTTEISDLYNGGAGFAYPFSAAAPARSNLLMMGIT